MTSRLDDEPQWQDGSVARILVLTNMYPPHHQGGYELSCRDVVEKWRDKGHHVEVLTSTVRLPGVADPLEPHVHRELTIFLQDGALWSPPLLKRLRVEADNESCLARHIGSGFDVVSVWHMGAMSVGLLGVVRESGLPTVFVVCDDWPTYMHKLDPWARVWWRAQSIAPLGRRITRVHTTIPELDTAGTYCFVSENAKARCIRHSTWTFPRSTVTYSGIDHSDFPIDNVVPKETWKGRLLVAGRLDPRKGFETALKALPLLPGATLEILSGTDDAYRTKLAELAESLEVNQRVRFDTVERQLLGRRYAEADVFLFPSEWDEPFGLVPVEAMACGTPVVATGVGGSGEFLVDEVNCLLVPPGDPDALALAVRRLAGDATLRRRLVSGGIDTARELSVDRLAEVLEDWHLSVLPGAPKPAKHRQLLGR